MQCLEPGGSASAAGVKQADVIEKVAGKNVMGKAVREVVPLIAGPEGSEVTVTVLRGPNRNRLEISMQRAKRGGPPGSSPAAEDKVSRQVAGSERANTGIASGYEDMAEARRRTEEKEANSKGSNRQAAPKGRQPM